MGMRPVSLSTIREATETREESRETTTTNERTRLPAMECQSEYFINPAMVSRDASAEVIERV